MEYNSKCCAEFKKREKLAARQDILATGIVMLRNYLVMLEHLLCSLVAFCYAFGCNLLESSIAIYVVYHAVNPDSRLLTNSATRRNSATNADGRGAASFQWCCVQVVRGRVSGLPANDLVGRASLGLW